MNTLQSEPQFPMQRLVSFLHSQVINALYTKNYYIPSSISVQKPHSMYLSMQKYHHCQLNKKTTVQDIYKALFQFTSYMCVFVLQDMKRKQLSETRDKQIVKTLKYRRLPFRTNSISSQNLQVVNMSVHQMSLLRSQDKMSQPE